MLGISRHKHHRRGELEVLQGLGQLKAGGLGHVHVHEHDVAGILFQLLDSLAHVGSFGCHFNSADLIEKKAQFRTGRRLVVNDNCVKHVVLQKKSLIAFILFYSTADAPSCPIMRKSRVNSR